MALSRAHTSDRRCKALQCSWQAATYTPSLPGRLDGGTLGIIMQLLAAQGSEEKGQWVTLKKNHDSRDSWLFLEYVRVEDTSLIQLLELFSALEETFTELYMQDLNRMFVYCLLVR